LRCFSSPGSPPEPIDSVQDTARAVGCPIRRSRDRRSLASPPGFSQRATSFIASQCQGIHQMPFSYAPPRTQQQSPPDARLLPKTLRQTRAQPTRRAPGPPPRSRHVSPLHPINQPPETASHRPRPPGGGERVRTDDLLLAKQALSQLSYTPVQMTEDRRQKTEPAPGGGPGRI